MTEKENKRESLGRCGRYSLTRFYDDDGKNDFVLQQSRLITKRDEKGKIILSADGKNIEREWLNKSMTISANDFDDIIKLLETGKPTKKGFL